MALGRVKETCAKLEGELEEGDLEDGDLEDGDLEDGDLEGTEMGILENDFDGATEERYGLAREEDTAAEGETAEEDEIIGVTGGVTFELGVGVGAGVCVIVEVIVEVVQTSSSAMRYHIALEKTTVLPGFVQTT